MKWFDNLFDKMFPFCGVRVRVVQMKRIDGLGPVYVIQTYDSFSGWIQYGWWVKYCNEDRELKQKWETNYYDGIQEAVTAAEKLYDDLVKAELEKQRVKLIKKANQSPTVYWKKP